MKLLTYLYLLLRILFVMGLTLLTIWVIDHPRESGIWYARFHKGQIGEFDKR
ncbi:MAG: hypothetical protein HQK96_03795 [Nitrospirae bacterium]|nr:hypothetical protein [Nitrospirota bacterium]